MHRMCLLRCLSLRRKQQQWIDVLVDIDDTLVYAGVNIEAGEEENLLKVYPSSHFSGRLTLAQQVYRARAVNNLVRALGLIVKSIEMSRVSDQSVSVVQALKSLQWNDDNYLHDSSNAEEIYQIGLQAMQEVNGEFSLVSESSSTCPWTPLDENDETLFPRQRNMIIRTT